VNDALEVFRKKVLQNVEEVGRWFDEPDDDWGMALLLDCADRFNVCVLAVPAEDKHRLPAIVAGLFREMPPRHAALVVSAWTVELPASTPGPMVDLEKQMLARFGIENHPKARETLLVKVANPSDEATWMAAIRRSQEAPPTLGPWEKADDRPDGILAGILRAAFAALPKSKKKKKGG
jgi:hypothetical protein